MDIVQIACAFMEQWQPDTNSFHMLFEKITILLHDVQCILSIPVEGEMMTDDPKWETAKNQCMSLLNISAEDMKPPNYKSGAMLESFVKDRVRGSTNPEVVWKPFGIEGSIVQYWTNQWSDLTARAINKLRVTDDDYDPELQKEYDDLILHWSQAR
ncbi:OLC1v1022331C1 [Oldenlandia corymbosa var. corymbosa]|uniref:OLC1v1022331C1 n=1 Tax=Oldenlandia corymbosa var. corymbosa TaxID=529605 RepID=A0AAV1BXM3_OLDCO|nr:OLC1v1022331C1 [Oldenlandia corymbosa var. corymbosa]